MATTEAQVINGNAMPITVEEKFQAALTVIQSLPKNGSYKPSPSMMLKFYSYYKQATEGPCTKPKPWAWDVINKAKWDAWTKLGDMSKAEAMEHYVENLKLVMAETPPPTDRQIVEAMPATDNVQEFIKILGNFYQVVDLEPPKQYQKFSKITSTPKDGHDSTPPLLNGNDIAHHQNGGNGHIQHSEEDSEESDKEEDMVRVPKINGNDSSESEDGGENGERILPSDSEDEFCDTAEEIESGHRNPSTSQSMSYTLVNPEDPIESDSVSTMDSSLEREHSHQYHHTDISTNTVRLRTRGGEHGTRGSDKTSFTSPQSGLGSGGSGERGSRTGNNRMGQNPGSSGGSGNDPPYSYSEVQNQIATTLLQLQQDMNSVLNRLSILEALTVGQQARRGRTVSGGSSSSTSSHRHRSKEISSPSWWPFKDIGPRTLCFIVLWPFVVRWILYLIRKKSITRMRK
uniref:acyl-CoA-binding domain-containing protein 5-like isoform X1 n=1 Tax=Styela clava TaxID=7725 RepID=UPI00193A8F2F|nr:acyl-CoA-binding domain-containing protein 5-like isoform X1 [Styela clava]